jgi:hypothetical protein
MRYSVPCPRFEATISTMQVITFPILTNFLSRWEHDVKMGDNSTRKLDYSGLRQGVEASTSEHCNEPSVSIKGGKFL